MSESNLDRGLAEAFGASSEHSVLRAIERITGDVPRVLLRDADLEHEASPILDPSSSERRSIPQGRGSYQMLGEIARGGMGVVMKGHDNDLGRDVALKVLHRELAKRPEVLQRFVEEAQIGGQLQHPGIVPVYELGLMADERPYFTMKLVKGRTLAALLAERTSAVTDRRRFLDVFESVCQTMAYAHSRGVIHRDLKPANVMVGAFGEVQVVDWGLAKVLRQGGTADEKRAKQTSISIIETVRSEPGSHGSHSLVGSVMGTPAYMSPEQARGEVEKLDERSDVFSLGAILCEILTGAPPYRGESDKTLVEAASAKLDDATKRLDGCEADPELVRLCRDCLTPAQSARPRSAEVVAQRIHGHLISVEERARQAQVDAAEARVKAQEERRARKLTVGLAGSVLVTVLVAGGGWAWLSSESSRRERDTATQVGAALDEATLKRGEGLWAAALAAVERAKGLADSGEASRELRARVANDSAAIEGDAKRARAKAALALDNAALLAELADVRQPEGDTIYPTDWAKLDADHRTIFARHGLDLDERNPIDDVTALNARGIPVELAAALDEWAALRSRADDTTGAAYLVSLATRVDADATRCRLRTALIASDIAALKSFAASEELARLPATTLNLLGAALARSGARREALSVYRQAQRVHPSDFTLSMNLARTLLDASPKLAREATRYSSASLALRPTSAEAIHELGRTLDEDLNEHERAMELFLAAVLLHPGDAHLLGHLGISQTSMRQFDSAIESCRRSLAIDPSSAWVMVGLGLALQGKGELDAAIASFGKAIELDPNSANAHVSLGTALGMKGQIEAAVEHFRRAIAIDPKSSKAHDNLGNGLSNLGLLDQAIESYRRAIELNPNVAVVYDNLGLTLMQKGLTEEAIGNYRRAIDLDAGLASAHKNLGIALGTKGLLDDAIASFHRAIDLEPGFALTHCNLGLALQKKGLLDEAITSYQRAVELDPKSGFVRSNLGTALKEKGRLDDAIECWRLATALDPKLGMAHFNLAFALDGKMLFDEAIAHYQRAIELDPKQAILHFRLGNDFRNSGRIEAAIECWHHALAIDPDHGDSLNNLAWILATSPRPDLRDPAEAVRLARHAVEVAPGEDGLWNTLGVALYVHGELAECASTLQHSIDMRAGGDPTDWLFLAMAEHKLGHTEAARSWYDKSVHWLDEKPAGDELARFRLEAEQTLGLATKVDKQ